MRHRYLEANRVSAVWPMGFAKMLMVVMMLISAVLVCFIAAWLIGLDVGQDPNQTSARVLGRSIYEVMLMSMVSLSLAWAVWKELKRIKAVDRLTAKSDRLPCIDCGQVLELQAGGACACHGCGAEVDAVAMRDEWAKVRAGAWLGEMVE